jgi:multiple sugar transport system permease protein
VRQLLRLITAGVIMIPLLWTFLTAFKAEPEVYHLWPLSWHPENFRASLEIVPMLAYTANTLLLGALCCLGHLLSCPLAAYALARKPSRATRVIWALTLAAYVVPYPVVMLGQYALFLKAGWVNSFLPLVVPALLGNPFFILYLTQVFRRFPKELEEAAIMEGAGDLTILTKIVMPICRPALAAMVVLTLQGVWNDFLAPLLYLQDQSLYTVNLGLQFYRSAYEVSWSLMMAATTISVLPVVLLFFFAQGAFLGGTMEGSEK